MKIFAIGLMLVASMVLASESKEFQGSPTASPFIESTNDAVSSEQIDGNSGSSYSNQIELGHNGFVDPSGRIDEAGGLNYHDHHYSYYSSAKEDYGGGNGGYGDGGYGSSGGYSGSDSGYHGEHHGNDGGYEYDGRHPQHNGHYETSKPSSSPFKGLLRAGALLLPILIILGLGLFFPSVITVPVRRKRSAEQERSFESKPSTFMDVETMTYATKMLMRASQDDICLNYIACKLGERSGEFPLRARVLSLIQNFLPSDLNDYFKTFVNATRRKRCHMKFPKKCQ